MVNFNNYELIEMSSTSKWSLSSVKEKVFNFPKDILIQTSTNFNWNFYFLKLLHTFLLGSAWTTTTLSQDNWNFNISLTYHVCNGTQGNLQFIQLL